MNKIPGYDESPAYTGEGQALPAGKYICEIKGARVATTQSGKEQLVLQLDIADGEYRGFYEARYKADYERKGASAKWNNGGLFRQGFEGQQLPFFHGLMTCIEKSNPGYKWDWNEKGLKGKKLGVLFGREQFRAGDGTVKWATKATSVRSIEGLKNAEIPKDRLLDGRTSSQGYTTAGFADMDVDEDDLPF